MEGVNRMRIESPWRQEQGGGWAWPAGIVCLPFGALSGHDHPPQNLLQTITCWNWTFSGCSRHYTSHRWLVSALAHFRAGSPMLY